jgi:hypothetical protein
VTWLGAGDSIASDTELEAVDGPIERHSKVRVFTCDFRGRSESALASDVASLLPFLHIRHVVALPRIAAGTTRLQLLVGVLTDGFEHPIPDLSLLLLRKEHRRIDKPIQCLQHTAEGVLEQAHERVVRA